MKKYFILLCAAAMAVVILSACAGDAATAADEEIVLRYPTFEVGVNATAPLLAEVVRRFNEENAGSIRVEIEEIPGDTEFAHSMSVRLAADDLPDIITNKGGQNLFDVFVDAGVLVDLTPYIDPAWRATIDAHAWEVNSRNGRVYAVPDERSIIGYWFNRELFEQAGVTPARTWDEFWVKTATLLEAGITPLSMDTDDTAWLTNLWTGPLIASQGPEGYLFMTDTFLPTNYNFPDFINAMGYVQRMFMNYTTLDAVGGRFENGAHNFLNGQTAMLANGPWMIADFIEHSNIVEGFVDLIEFAVFPGSVVHDSPQFGYSISLNADESVREAALDFIRFKTSAEVAEYALVNFGRIPTNTDVIITDEMKAANRLLGELVERSADAALRINVFQGQWFPNVLDAISSNYPLFATGAMSPEELADLLTQTAELN